MNYVSYEKGASLVFALLYLLRSARIAHHTHHELTKPTTDELTDVERVIAGQSLTYPCLAYLRDKALLFNDAHTAFLMYGVQSRTWVALGDPVGPKDELPNLIRLFIERSDEGGGIPVFYEIGKSHLHVYADFGLKLVKLGEEAKVDLTRFTLEGSSAAKLRQSLRRLEKDRCTFRVLPPEMVPAYMGELRRVSADWLSAKSTAEKGFSLGFFDEAYLCRFPVAVIERAGRVQAFANLWLAPNHVEASIDLMRYHRDAPKSVMEALLVHLLQWAQSQGFQRFVLGMAPLSGFEESTVASIWNRLGSFVYEHGERIYGFQGLRAYKEKFDPVWEPHYLAYPGGFHLPRIMADVTALVAGGYRHIFLK
jgi:phosphatidylglycerol lysyltransferase